MARGAGAQRLLVRGDSDVALRYASGNGVTRVARLLPLIARAQTALAAFEHAQLLWVPNHRNRDADRLARQALGLAPAEFPANHPNRPKLRRR